MTRIHCIVAIDAATGEEHIFRPHEIEEGLKLLSSARRLIGHNIIGFDIPAVRKLYPKWEPKGEVIDTLVLTRLFRPDLMDVDSALIAKGRLFPNLRKSHSLEAWGQRIGTHKSQFGKTADWSKFTEEMLEYCVQDVRVNVDLLKFLDRQKLSPMAVSIELEIAQIMQRQEENGIGFNRDAALELQAELQNKAAEVTDRLRKVFKPWFFPGKVRTTPTTRRMKLDGHPYVTMPRYSEKTGKRLKDYRGPPLATFTAGTALTPIRLTEFSPGSRDHIWNRLMAVYGWVPRKFSKKDNKPQIDETVLEGLPESVVPRAVKEDLMLFLAINKILGMLGQGAQSWLRNVNPDTLRIHGRVITNGAVTGRATHRNPNIAQIPKVALDENKQVLLGYDGGWGWESRSLFVPREGWEMVGADCSGLELRNLAHYLDPLDGGEYTKIVTKEDPHSYHQGLAKLSTRAVAKTWIYAFIYGAGSWLLGHTANPELDDAGKERLGRQLMRRFLKNFPALRDLREMVRHILKERGYLIGLDGRRIYARSLHAALNALLQSAGAVVCKQWIIEFVAAMDRLGHKWGRDYALMAWVHDEIQVECRPGLGEVIAKEAVEAAVRAGEFFKLRCPSSGEAKQGRSWAHTH